MILLKLLIFVLGFILGLLILKYQERIVYTIGKSEWAESRLGAGGTYTMWRFIGIGLIIISFLIALFI